MPIPARMSRITHTCTWNTYTSEKRCPSISVKGAEMSSLLLYCKHVITSTRDRDHEITKRCLRKSGITSSKWLVHHRDKKKACFRSGFAAAHSASGQLPSQQSPQAGLTGWLLRRCFPFWNMTGMWRERERERETSVSGSSSIWQVKQSRFAIWGTQRWAEALQSQGPVSLESANRPDPGGGVRVKWILW